jgi:DNA-binding MarR family transcriptional regulator
MFHTGIERDSCLIEITLTKARRFVILPEEQGRLQQRAVEGFFDVAATSNPAMDAQVGLLRDTVVALVRRDGVDLSARQLGVFLTCYLNEGAHTVRGLAADLNVSKPAITRALDRLGELNLARRKVDPLDRRSVLVQRTPKGSAFLRNLRSMMNGAPGPRRKASRKAA